MYTIHLSTYLIVLYCGLVIVVFIDVEIEREVAMGCYGRFLWQAVHLFSILCV